MRMLTVRISLYGIPPICSTTLRTVATTGMVLGPISRHSATGDAKDRHPQALTAADHTIVVEKSYRRHRNCLLNQIRIGSTPIPSPSREYAMSLDEISRNSRNEFIPDR
jgi:hypothetical protein